MTDEELIARLNTVYALLEDEGYYTKANTVDYAATRIIKLLEEKDVHLSTLEHMGMAVERMQKTEERALMMDALGALVSARDTIRRKWGTTNPERERVISALCKALDVYVVPAAAHRKDEETPT